MCSSARRPAPLRETGTRVRTAGRRAIDNSGGRHRPGSVAGCRGPGHGRAGSAFSIAVAAAGVNAWASIDELRPAALAAALATNVAGVAHLARAVLPGMRARRDGRLVVIASDNGRRPEAGGGAYVASKFGAVGLALSIAAELHADGVNVHVVEPGCVDTPWYPPEEVAPRERMLAPEDVALSVLFLVDAARPHRHRGAAPRPAPT